MTLEEIENSLPNGLHDAEVERISIDYQQRTMIIDLAVFVGDLGAAPEKREAYRSASLIISGLQFVTIEPPDPHYSFSKAGTLRIDSCNVTKNVDAALLQALPKDSFCRSLFVNEWNAFVHFAASTAEIEWKAPAEYRKQREHFVPGEIVDL